VVSDPVVKRLASVVTRKVEDQQLEPRLAPLLVVVVVEVACCYCYSTEEVEVEDQRSSLVTPVLNRQSLGE
jgi:hypothetical protein